MWEDSRDEGCSSVAKAPSWSYLFSGGLASEKDYPFRGHANPHKCQANNYKKVAWIQDFTMLSSNEQGMARVAMEGDRGLRNQSGSPQAWLWEAL